METGSCFVTDRRSRGHIIRKQSPAALRLLYLQIISLDCQTLSWIGKIINCHMFYMPPALKKSGQKVVLDRRRGVCNESKN
jgi:hypothetical protein